MSLMKVIDMNELRQKQDDPLGLGGLPPVAPDEDGWPAIEAALLENTRRRNLFRWAGGAVAVAAALVLAMTVVLVQPVQNPANALPADDQTMNRESVPEPLRDPNLEALIAMSQQLESRVRLYRDRFGDLPSNALVYQVELQDLIVQVDEELSANPDSTELWGQRVNLLLDVTQLYEHSLRRDYDRMASL